jgi:hypothetical protein
MYCHEGFSDVAAVFFVSSTGGDYVIYPFFFRAARSHGYHPRCFCEKGTYPGGAPPDHPRGVSLVCDGAGTAFSSLLHRIGGTRGELLTITGGAGIS